MSASGDGEKGGTGDYTGGAIDPNRLGVRPPPPGEPERAEQGPDDLFSRPPKSWPELVGGCGRVVTATQIS